MYLLNLIEKQLLTLLFFCFVLISANAQSKLYPEQRIYLWDVTGSLLPNVQGVKDTYNSNTLPVYKGGNGLWNTLKKNLVNSLQSIEEDGVSEIVIVPFYTHVLEQKHYPATQQGKVNAINYVKGKDYVRDGECKTNLVDPIEIAYSLTKKNYVNYIFVFTDGENQVGNLNKTLNQWTQNTQCEDQWTFGFYTLVDPIAKTPEVNHAAATQKNFFIVDDAKQIIHLVQMPPKKQSYNYQTDQSQTIILSGNFQDAKGNIMLESTNSYYDIVAESTPVSIGKLTYSLKAKPGVTPPVEYDIELTAKLSGQDIYTFQTINQCSVRVFNRRENVMRFEPIKK